jgi:hypothetical protein
LLETLIGTNITTKQNAKITNHLFFLIISIIIKTSALK